MDMDMELVQSWIGAVAFELNLEFEFTAGNRPQGAPCQLRQPEDPMGVEGNTKALIAS